MRDSLFLLADATEGGLMAVDTGLKPTTVSHPDAQMVCEPARSVILNLLGHE